MPFQLKPITITVPQMMAAAQKIAEATDNAWEYTEEQFLMAVENWLRVKINDVLADPDWYANKDGFDADCTCDYPGCLDKAAPHSVACTEHSGYCTPDEAKELIMPQPPEWINQPVKEGEELPF